MKRLQDIVATGRRKMAVYILRLHRERLAHTQYRGCQKMAEESGGGRIRHADVPSKKLWKKQKLSYFRHVKIHQMVVKGVEDWVRQVSGEWDQEQKIVRHI